MEFEISKGDVILFKTNQLKIGALFSYISIFVNMVAGIIYTPWMIRQIGDSDYGIYTLALSVISLLLVDVGLGATASRYVAKFRAEKRDADIPAFLGMVYKIYLVIDILIFFILLVIYFCMDVIYVNFTDIELKKFKGVFLMVGLYSVISFPCTTFNGILIAYERFIALKIADFIQKIGSICITIVALLCGAGLYALVLIQTFFGLLAIIIKYWSIRKCTSVSFHNQSRQLFKGIVEFSAWSAVHGLAQRLIFNISPSILGITVANATTAIAIFGVVSNIEGYVYLLSTALSGLFLSKITRILHAKDKESLQYLATQVGRFQFWVNGLLVIGFMFVGRPFIHLWVGETFSLAYTGILLVIFPGLFFNPLQIFTTALTAENHVKEQAWLQLIIGGINLVLSFWLSSMWGVLGSFMSIFTVYVFRWILTLILIHQKLCVNLKDYAKKCYVKMLVPLCVTGGIVFVLVRNVEINTWGNLIMMGMVIVAIYVVSTLFLGLYKEERRKLFNRLKRN